MPHCKGPGICISPVSLGGWGMYVTSPVSLEDAQTLPLLPHWKASRWVIRKAPQRRKPGSGRCKLLSEVHWMPIAYGHTLGLLPFLSPHVPFSHSPRCIAWRRSYRQALDGVGSPPHFGKVKEDISLLFLAKKPGGRSLSLP